MWLRQHAFMHLGQRFPDWLFLVTGIYLWFFVAGYIVVQLFHFVINRCTPATACHTLNSWLSHGLHGLVSKCTFAWGFCCWKNREGQDFNAFLSYEGFPLLGHPSQFAMGCCICCPVYIFSLRTTGPVFTNFGI